MLPPKEAILPLYLEYYSVSTSQIESKDIRLGVSRRRD